MPNALVQSLYDRIYVAKLELERARKECPHAKHRLEWFMQRPGSLRVLRLCEDCDIPVGDPSVEELAEFEERDGLAQHRKQKGCGWRMIEGPVTYAEKPS